MSFIYPHPLINIGAGRKKTDPENQRRIHQVFNRYQQWLYHSKGKKFQLPITKNQVYLGFAVYPTVGFIIGLIGSAAFVHKNSKYIGKFFVLGSTFGGYLFSRRHWKAYNSFKYFYNFPNYPSDIQKMIDNNDSRYAHRWLRDDYLKIKDA